MIILLVMKFDQSVNVAFCLKKSTLFVPSKRKLRWKNNFIKATFKSLGSFKQALLCTMRC